MKNKFYLILLYSIFFMYYKIKADNKNNVIQIQDNCMVGISGDNIKVNDIFIEPSTKFKIKIVEIISTEQAVGNIENQSNCKDIEKKIIYKEQVYIEIEKTKISPKIVITPNITVIPKVVIIPNATVIPKEVITPNATVIPKEVIAPNATVIPKEVIAPNATVIPKVVITPNATKAEIAKLEKFKSVVLNENSCTLKISNPKNTFKLDVKKQALFSIKNADNKERAIAKFVDYDLLKEEIKLVVVALYDELINCKPLVNNKVEYAYLNNLQVNNQSVTNLLQEKITDLPKTLLFSEVSNDYFLPTFNLIISPKIQFLNLVSMHTDFDIILPQKNMYGVEIFTELKLLSFDHNLFSILNSSYSNIKSNLYIDVLANISLQIPESQTESRLSDTVENFSEKLILNNYRLNLKWHTFMPNNIAPMTLDIYALVTSLENKITGLSNASFITVRPINSYVVGLGFSKELHLGSDVILFKLLKSVYAKGKTVEVKGVDILSKRGETLNTEVSNYSHLLLFANASLYLKSLSLWLNSTEKYHLYFNISTEYTRNTGTFNLKNGNISFLYGGLAFTIGGKLVL